MASKRGKLINDLAARIRVFDEGEDRLPGIPKRSRGRDHRGGYYLDGHQGVFHRPGSSKK